MQKIIVCLAMLFATSVFGQNKPSVDSGTQNEFEAAKRIMDSSVHPLKYAKSVDDFLSAIFTENSSKDGRWVFYKNWANLKS